MPTTPITGTCDQRLGVFNKIPYEDSLGRSEIAALSTQSRTEVKWHVLEDMAAVLIVFIDYLFSWANFDKI